MNQILYGVGQSILKDFLDVKKVIALSHLKDVTVSGSSNEEVITAGDNPYPLAKFPADKTITISGTSATFSLKQMNITQGADITIGAVVFTDAASVVIPSSGQVHVDHEIDGDPIIRIHKVS